ncbi:hypothetical protein ADUPG1_005941, partial [Aduncisulcus paluster]
MVVFLHGFASSTPKDVIAARASQYGEVLRLSKKKKICFIEYSSQAEEELAITKFRGWIIDGNRIGAEKAKHPLYKASKKEPKKEPKKKEDIPPLFVQSDFSSASPSSTTISLPSLATHSCPCKDSPSPPAKSKSVRAEFESPKDSLGLNCDGDPCPPQHHPKRDFESHFSMSNQLHSATGVLSQPSFVSLPGGTRSFSHPRDGSNNSPSNNSPRPQVGSFPFPLGSAEHPHHQDEDAMLPHMSISRTTPIHPPSAHYSPPSLMGTQTGMSFSSSHSVSKHSHYPLLPSSSFTERQGNSSQSDGHHFSSVATNPSDVLIQPNSNTQTQMHFLPKASLPYYRYSELPHGSSSSTS